MAPMVMSAALTRSVPPPASDWPFSTAPMCTIDGNEPGPSTTLLLSSVMLPALVPATVPVLRTLAPPDTSMRLASWRFRPCAARSATEPPASAGAALAPPMKTFDQSPATSIVRPASSTTAPDTVAPPVAAEDRSAVRAAKLPPTAWKLPPSTMPPAPPAPRSRLAALPRAMSAPACCTMRPSVVTVTLPAPLAFSVAAETRLSAGNSAVSGSAQNAAGSDCLSLSMLRSPSPAALKSLLPKAPPLLRVPSSTRPAVASASTPAVWRRPAVVAAVNAPSSTACGA